MASDNNQNLQESCHDSINQQDIAPQNENSNSAVITNEMSAVVTSEELAETELQTQSQQSAKNQTCAENSNTFAENNDNLPNNVNSFQTEVDNNSTVDSEILSKVDTDTALQNGDGALSNGSENGDGALSNDSELTTESEIAQSQNQQPKWKKVFSKVFNWVLIAAIIFLLVLNVVKIFFLAEVEVSGDSMKPTFSTGDKVQVNKIVKPQTSNIVVVYKYDIDSKIKAYFSPAKYRVSNGKYAMLIKRAVAVAGDTISMEVKGGNYYLKILKGDKWLYEFYCWDTDCSSTLYANRPSGKYVLAESLAQAQSYGVYVEQISMTSSNVGMLKSYLDVSYTLTSSQILVLGDNRAVSSDSRQNGFSSYSRLLGVVI